MIVIVVMLVSQIPAESASSGIDYRGTVYQPPLELMDFTLPASTGQDLSLSDMRGQWVLMFFGYTRCPDVCPITLNEFRQVKAELGDGADAVNFLFISVDSPRDTPDVIGTYLARFDSDFIGMSGEDDVLERITDDYSLFYERHTDEGEYYSVDHTGRSYLIDPQGMLRISYAYGTTSDVIADTIRDLMNES